MAILIELHLDRNVCTISIIPSVISSGESWNKLFVAHRITTFLRLDMTWRFCAHHKRLPITSYITIWVFRGSWYFVQTLWYLFSPAANESLIIIILKGFLLSCSSDDNGNLTNLFLKTSFRELSS